LKTEDLWFRFALSIQFKSIKLLKYQSGYDINPTQT
jgi:hypothetical protein